MWRPILLHVFAISCLLTASLPLSNAFPSGAGGCAGGQPAVGSTHLSARYTTGDISVGGFLLLLDGTPLKPGSNNTFYTGKDNYLQIISSENQFRGFLLRLGGNGVIATTRALRVPKNATDIRLAKETCIAGGVGGLTHTEPSVKMSASGILRMDSAAANFPLDVTIVVQNRNGDSEFYYSNYTLTAVRGKRPVTRTRPLSPTIAPFSARASVPRSSPSAFDQAGTPPPTVQNTVTAIPTVSPAPTISPKAGDTLAPSMTQYPSTTALPTLSPTSEAITTFAPTMKPVASLAPTRKPVAPTLAPTRKTVSTLPPTRGPVSTLAPTRRPVSTLPPTPKPATTLPPTRKPAVILAPTEKPVSTLAPTLTKVTPVTNPAHVALTQAPSFLEPRSLSSPPTPSPVRPTPAPIRPTSRPTVVPPTLSPLAPPKPSPSIVHATAVPVITTPPTVAVSTEPKPEPEPVGSTTVKVDARNSRRRHYTKKTRRFSAPTQRPRGKVSSKVGKAGIKKAAKKAAG